MKLMYVHIGKENVFNFLSNFLSGGTDIIACFMGENSTLAVHRGQVSSIFVERSTTIN
jgi:uncharacterized protein with von Willebrand factor type A (vWA) domain